MGFQLARHQRFEITLARPGLRVIPEPHRFPNAEYRVEHMHETGTNAQVSAILAECRLAGVLE